MVSIITEPISVDAVLDAVRAPDAGAVVLFLGAVRDNTDGRAVTGLEYEAYIAMALAEMERLVTEAHEAWNLVQCAIVHRTGSLAVGEVSIAVAVSAPRRADAFPAARFLIDRLKQSVPIWKKERFADGGHAWGQGA